MQAFREVYEATVGFQSARSNSYAKSVMEEAAGKYITLANSQYINGVINYIDVLDAQRKYLSSQIEFNEAKTREKSGIGRSLQGSRWRLELSKSCTSSTPRLLRITFHPYFLTTLTHPQPHTHLHVTPRLAFMPFFPSHFSISLFPVG